MERGSVILQHIDHALRQGRVVVCDGAAFTMLGPDPGREALLRLHREYVEAGAEMLTASTFAERSPGAIAEAAGAALEAAGGRMPVAGLIGGLGPEESAVQVAALEEAGVDLLLYETIYDCELAEATLAAIGTRLPIILSATFTDGMTLPSGHTVEQFASLVRRHGAIGAGANCGASLSSTLRAAEALRGCARWLIVRPSAGIPDASGRRPLGPDEWAAPLKLVGGAIVGGCCGTTPGHIAALRRLIDCKDCQKS